MVFISILIPLHSFPIFPSPNPPILTMDAELELLIDDIVVTRPTLEPNINEVVTGEELVCSSYERMDESSNKCLVDGILDARYVDQIRAKVLARKKARIALELEKSEELQSINSKSCLEVNAARNSAMSKSKDNAIGADMESAMVKILVDVHDLSTIGAKLVGQVELERTKAVAEEKSKLECQNELHKVKAELEQVRQEKEKAATSQRAITYMGWHIGARRKLLKAKDELASRRETKVVEVIGDDSVTVHVFDESNEAVGVGNEGNRKKPNFDLNTIPEDCLEEGEIGPYAQCACNKRCRK